MVAMLLDTETGDRLTGGGDAVDDLLGPATLDADDDDGCDVGIGAGTDEGTEMQLEVFTELQPAVGVGQRHGARNVIGHGLAGRVGQVIDRQDDDMVADPDTTVFAPVSGKSCRT